MPSCSAASAKFPPAQNRADSGTVKIEVNPTQVRQEMGHPVEWQQVDFFMSCQLSTHFESRIDSWIHSFSQLFSAILSAIIDESLQDYNRCQRKTQ